MFATNVDWRDILLMIALVTCRRHQKVTKKQLALGKVLAKESLLMMTMRLKLILLVDISANSMDTILDTRDPDLKRKKSSDSTESLTSTFELLSPAKSLFDGSEQQYPLSFDQLVELADKVPGESNILELIHRYISDIEGVSTMLYEIFPSLEHKSIKNRCRKIQRKIKKAQSNILDDNSHNMEVVVTTQDTEQ
jgi:hypothetical protein